jgi:hypothetical protein
MMYITFKFRCSEGSEVIPNMPLGLKVRTLKTVTVFGYMNGARTTVNQNTVYMMKLFVVKTDAVVALPNVQEPARGTKKSCNVIVEGTDRSFDVW